MAFIFIVYMTLNGVKLIMHHDQLGHDGFQWWSVVKSALNLGLLEVYIEMKSSPCRDTAPCSPVKVTNLQEGCISSIFRIEEKGTTMKQTASRSGLLLGLLFDP
jgi:hypothetical protein